MYSRLIVWQVAVLLTASGCIEVNPKRAQEPAAEAEEQPDVAADIGADIYKVKKPDTKGDASACEEQLKFTVIDGAFSPNEWTCGEPMSGKYSYLYVRLEGVQLHVLNDWYLRDAAPITPQMYNLFQFSTGDGLQAWRLKVFGDNHVELELDGQPVNLAVGASGYHPSPKVAQPHTIFEFVVGDVTNPVLPGGICFLNHDPSNQSNDPEGSLVREPTVFSAVLSADGGVQPTPNSGAILVSFAAGAVDPGADVTVLGAGLGEATGEVLIDGQDAQVLAWSEGKVVFKAPGAPGKITVKARTAAGTFSNALQLAVSNPQSADCAKLPKGRACDDGDPCTVQDQCDGYGGCGGKPSLGLLLCDDKNICTSDDSCVNGKCLGGLPLKCDDGLACTADSCKPLEGCVHKSAVGAPCSTGDKCLQMTVCGPTGQCGGGEKVACDDGLPCTADSCDPKVGCVASALAKGSSCSDGNACTSDDACSGGACLGTAAPLPSAPTCYKAQCNPATGLVSTIALTGTTCNDGLPCTKTDICVAGTCAGQPISCSDGNPCTADTCKATDGTCVSTPMAEADPCDDGNACTAQEKCTNAKCQGTPLVCNDGDPKTTDICVAGIGCVFQPK